VNVQADVSLYSTDYCPYCHRAKASKGARFAEINCEERPDLRSWLVEATQQRTVPQVFINGRSVGGFSDIAELERRGELDRMLSVPPSGQDPELRR
jgi:glutaredoxin 3